MNKHQDCPEIYCDLNAGRGNGYSIETNGSIRDLKELGLTPEKAVGMHFIFNSGLDENEAGEPADILFTGIVVEDEQWGYIAIPDDENAFFWRAV